MNAPDPAVLAEADDLVTDAVVRRCFGVGPVEDPSGLLGQPGLPAGASEDEMHDAYMRRHFPGSVAVAPEPKPATVGTSRSQQAAAMPELHQGPRTPAAADDGAMVDAYVAHFWPQSARNP